MPRTAGKMGFLHMRSQNCHTKLKRSGSSKEGQELFVGPAPILIFVFFGGAPGFSQQWVFQNRPTLAQTTVNLNVVPKWRGPKPQFLHRKCLKSAILELVARWSRNISHCNAIPFPFTFKKDKEHFLEFSCLFPSWQQVPFPIHF